VFPAGLPSKLICWHARLEKCSPAYQLVSIASSSGRDAPRGSAIVPNARMSAEPYPAQSQNSAAATADLTELSLGSALKLHADSVAGALRHTMRENDVLLGDEFQPVALRHSGDEERNLRQRQLRANADARTAPKRQIGEARSRGAFRP
jgi:hypothetical protein